MSKKKNVKRKKPGTVPKKPNDPKLSQVDSKKSEVKGESLDLVSKDQNKDAKVEALENKKVATDSKADKEKVKKGSSTESKSKKKKKHTFLRKIANYFKDLKSELKRVVWPTKQRVFRNTVVVLVTVLVVAVIVVVLDLGFQNLLKLLLGQF